MQPAIPPSLDKVRAVVRSACAGRPIERVEVFGSIARGSAGMDSDVDLLVEFVEGADIGLLEMGDLKEELEDQLGCRVDLLSRRAVSASRNLIRRQAILGNRLTIYAR